MAEVEQGSEQGSVWRWLLLPFAAGVVPAVGSWLVKALNYGSSRYIGNPDESWLVLYFSPIMASGVYGFLYSKTVYIVAPKHKFVTGIVMVTILAVVDAAVLGFGWWSGVFSGWMTLANVVSYVVMLAMAIGVVRDPDWTPN
ncbi:MAG: hypothetical protein JNM72_23230 [Deltaproteobacteria bacterium]|nr:hypothetical protein [Deltaproteobacteria bacterium]